MSTFFLNPESINILKILSDGQIHTDETLKLQFNYKKSSIYNVIHAAQQHGIKVNRLKGLGYYCEHPFSWMNKDAITKYLNHYAHLFELQIIDVIDSTNEYLLGKTALYKNYVQIPVVVAELQTNGRGRRQKPWYSCLGGSLTFSALWTFKPNFQSISGLTLAIGLALIRVFRNITFNDIQFKWPNDILWNNKKIAGILLECRTNLDGSIAAVIGIGINFKLLPDQIVSINSAAADLYDRSRKLLNRNFILALVIIQLRNILIQFEKTGFSAFRREWENSHAYNNQQVVLKMPDNTFIPGIVDGVQDDGSLRLLTESGIQCFSIGELTLRSLR